jgi:hypothetical protein
MIPIGYEQSQAANTGSNTTVAKAITPRAIGNLIVVFSGAADSAATLSISDNATVAHTWTTLTGPTVQTAVDVCRSWFTYANQTGPFTITITKTGGVQFMNILIDEFNNVVASSPVDGTPGGAFGSSLNPTSPSTTPTTANDVVWTACNDSLSAVPTGYTKAADDGATDWTAFKVLNGGSGVAQQAVWTGAGGNYQAHIALFKAASTSTVRIENTVSMRPRSLRY